MKKIMKFFKKISCIIPKDILVWIATFIALYIFVDSTATVLVSFCMLMLVYIVGNMLISAKRHGFYRYIAFWSPFLQKNNVYVFMNNNWFFKPFILPSPKRNPSKKDLFLTDMLNFKNSAKEGVIYSCHTHADMINIIQKYVETDIFTRPAYKSTLSKAYKMLCVADDKKEVAFFYTEFTKN